MQRGWLCLFLFVAMLALTPVAWASDGVTLINQASVSRGLPGCTNEPGYVITICQPGSYAFSGNIDPISTSPEAAANGIYIEADNVTLDLNGFTLSGSGPDGAGIVLGLVSPPTGPAGSPEGPAAASEVTILNGSISGFNVGIKDTPAPNSGSGEGGVVSKTQPVPGGVVSVRNVHISAQEMGVDLIANTADLEGVTVDFVHAPQTNGGSAIQIGTGTVRDCSVTIPPRSPGFGIRVVGGPAEILDNEIYSQGTQAAIEATGSANIVGNEIRAGAAGINVPAGQASDGGNEIVATPPVNGNVISMGDNVCGGIRC